MHVDSIDDTLARATSMGATVLLPKEAVGPMGWYAALTDSEGNQIGLWERAPGEP